jgi:hypothetical protein
VHQPPRHPSTIHGRPELRVGALRVEDLGVDLLGLHDDHGRHWCGEHGLICHLLEFDFGD